MFKILYLAASLGTVGLLLLEAPSGALLTSTPDRGKVIQSRADPKAVGTTTHSPAGAGVRTFALWAFVAGASSGGYQGGK